MLNERIEIVFDTETTGLNKDVDRIVEIGCVKIADFKVVERFHKVINPQRHIPQEATNIHGIDDEAVKGKPVFAEIVDEFLAFIGNYNLVAHNAFFDLGMINAELKRLNKPKLDSERIVDTLRLARVKFPNQSNRLDDLCQRYEIDLSARAKYHGALLDSELLAKVYLELSDAKQKQFMLLDGDKFAKENYNNLRLQLEQRSHNWLTEEQQKEHLAFVKEYLGEDSLWGQYYDEQLKQKKQP